ncbi:hypothetical protein COCCADRAFT_110782, partial [Bipolaris zeicola 26-R-13]
MVQHSEPHLVLWQEEKIGNVLQEACNVSGARTVSISELTSHESISSAVDVSSSELGEVYAKDSAMIMYTSGSTGTPKGILLAHEGLRNWVEAALHLFEIGRDETFLQQTSCSFDMCFVQIFLALCSGGLLCLTPTKLRADATFITEAIATENITFTGATPSEYSNWHRYGDHRALSQSLSHWRTALTGGEATTYATLELFSSLAGSGDYGNGPRFFNVYGPTETTIGATGTELEYFGDFKSAEIHVGKPLAGCLVYVMDERLQPVPVGIQGEIVIGGAGVARGYLKNQELSSERFVPNPLVPQHYRAKGWTKMHRTGDIGRWREDGALLIEGRKSGDTQIKLRGLRIDLAEIENSILRESQNTLAQVVVSVRHSTQPSVQFNEGFLVAHVKFQPGVFPSRGEQQAFLNELLARLPLPQYMRPAAAFPVENLPMMISGKLNRKAVADLPLEQEGSSSLAYLQRVTDNRPLTKTEARLKDLWEACISDDISKQYAFEPNTDFFHVGGNSTLLLKLQYDIRRNFDVSLTLLDMFQYSTL